MVDEYVSDELVSGSEDEKRLKKAKEAASRKRRQLIQGRRVPDKKFKRTSTSTDQQLFRGELACVFIFFLRSLGFCLIIFAVLCLFSRLLRFASYPPIFDFAWVFAVILAVNNLRSFERSELERKHIFHCYFSFAFFLQFVAFRCRSALIVVSDWLVLPI